MPRKSARKSPLSKLEAEQQQQKKRCTRRDIMLGFWIGLAAAAIYINVEIKPVPKSRVDIKEDGEKDISSKTTTSVSVTDPPNSGGFSAIPPAAKKTGLPVKVVAPPVTRSTSETSSQRDFFEIAMRKGTDKVTGAAQLPGCLKDNSSCMDPGAINPRCRVPHMYHTIYQKWLGPYSTDDTEPFQFVEIGHYHGKGYEAYKEFLPKAETHSFEIACLPKGPQAEGKWPYGNFPKENPRYQEFLDSGELHCGDGTNYDFLQETWTTKINRPGAPPLKVVVDDASHLSDHMVKSLLFWFPKIAPGGILVLEDIQPNPMANAFRTHVVSQLLKDLHYCGDPKWRDTMCFPTIQPLLQSIHCELHICILERNEFPSVEYGREEFTPPPNALNGETCLLHSTPN